jgi:NAD-dependent DNA ligase
MQKNEIKTMNKRELLGKLEADVKKINAKNALSALDIMYQSYCQSESSEEKQNMILQEKNVITTLLVKIWQFQEKVEKNEQKANSFLNSTDDSRKLSGDVKVQNLSIVENQNTIFYDKKVVISGIFDAFPVREDLAIILKKLGADINGTISKRTNIFIVGEDYGPAKMEKVEQLKSEGINIIIMNESDLIKALSGK